VLFGTGWGRDLPRLILAVRLVPGFFALGKEDLVRPHEAGEDAAGQMRGEVDLPLAFSAAQVARCSDLACGDFADADDFSLNEGELGLRRFGADVDVDLLRGVRSAAPFLFHRAERN
jgi:hypothetical protein